MLALGLVFAVTGLLGCLKSPLSTSTRMLQWQDVFIVLAVSGAVIVGLTLLSYFWPMMP